LPPELPRAHQPLHATRGPRRDRDPARHQPDEESVNQILAHHTGQPIDKIDKDTDRDYILQAPQAQEYGLVDLVISKRD
jgi:ATP-dependent Clp protease protease subunit